VPVTSIRSLIGSYPRSTDPLIIVRGSVVRLIKSNHVPVPRELSATDPQTMSREPMLTAQGIFNLFLILLLFAQPPTKQANF